MRQQDAFGMSGSIAVTGVGVEKAIGDEGAVDAVHAMLDRDNVVVVDKEILAGGAELTVVVSQPWWGESV